MLWLQKHNTEFDCNKHTTAFSMKKCSTDCCVKHLMRIKLHALKMSDDINALPTKFKEVAKVFKTTTADTHPHIEKSLPWPLNYYWEPRWKWDQEQEGAFTTWKSAPQSTPVCIQPNTTKQLYVKCDALDFATGAILSWKDANSKLHTVAYLSELLTPAKQNCWDFDAVGWSTLGVVRTEQSKLLDGERRHKPHSLIHIENGTWNTSTWQSNVKS